jgi:ribosomal protein S18 acetylase RimI-like enzyme
MTAPDYRIRCMSSAELELAADWAAAEGWNPGLNDAGIFRLTDPEGFLVGLRNGEPVASISVVRYPEGFAFLGFYIVRPEARGHGFGYQLWQAGMARLAGCTIGLDGVVAQQDNYRKSGFVLAWRNIRYGGERPAMPAPAGVVDARAVPLDALLAYDRRVFPAPRPAFLAAWINQPGAAARAVIRNGALAGFGVIRPCRSGFKIGPLFADDEHGAEALFAALSAAIDAGPVFLDVPENNAAARRLAERHALNPAFETARMYAGPPPAIDLNRQFGVTSFELG